MHPSPTQPRRNNFKRSLFFVIALAVVALAVLYLGAQTPATAADLTGGPPIGSGLYAAKSASAGLVAVGQTFSYTIHLRNMSTVNATVTVTDPLPAQVSYIADSATGGGTYDPGTRTLVWNGVTVTAGSEVRLTFVVSANVVAGPTVVVNTARIAAGNVVIEKSAWVMIVPASGFPSNLFPSFKMASRPVIASGDAVTYTIKLINASPIAATANVTDPVPARLTYIPGSVTGGGVYDGSTNTLNWTNIAVPPFGHVALSFAALTPGGIVTPTVITNVATIASGSQSFERRATIVVFDRPVPPPRPMLGGSFKAASQRIVVASDGFTYTIKLINSGTEDAIVDVTDPVPDQLTYVFGSASNDGLFNPNTNLLAWNAITVSAGSSVPLTFGVTATEEISRPTLVVNTATITVINHVSATATHPGVYKRQAVVLLVPTPPNVDVRPPIVHSLTIDEQDVLTSPTVTLHISATDNISVSHMFIREWQLTSTPRPHWEMIRSSGWVPYQPDYDWRLGSRNGTHFVGVWAMDAARNISYLDRRAFDFASLVLPGASVPLHGSVPYLVYYDKDVDVTAILTSTIGDADLYVWYPGNHFWPNVKSTQPLSGTDVITFTTPRAGLYLFVVRGYTAATYDLSIEPGGGPRGWLPWSTNLATDLATPSVPSAKPDDLTYDALLPESGLDPLGDGLGPDGPYTVYLPHIAK